MRLTPVSPIILAALLATLLAASACSRTDSSRVQDSTAARPADAPAALGSASGSASGSAASGKADTAATVTATGYGPLLIGMTVANAATALNSPIPSTAGLDTACAYVHIANAPTGMRIMVTGGTVARVEVDSSTIATGLGARVGDSESHIHDLYGSRVSVEPHKYLPNGHYLIVAPVPPTDSSFRLIFETDGSRVTKYRAGRLPQVQWVEGCA